jgi:hypothetical protein
MNFALFKIEWRNRSDALEPSATIAFEDAAISLAEKLLTLDDENLRGLQAVGAKKMILLVGDKDNLPWANGAVYLGRDSQIPACLLPTTIEPKLPPDLFGRIIETSFKRFAPFAVLPGKIIPFGRAKNLSRAVLEMWLALNR